MTASRPVGPPKPTPLVGASIRDDDDTDNVPDQPHFTQLRRVEPTALSDRDPINPVPLEAIAGMLLLVVAWLLIRRRRHRHA